MKYLVLILFTLLLFIGFTSQSNSRNEYLNEYGARCGDFETRVEKEDRNNDYRHYSDSNNYDSDSENYRLSFTYRKYLGVDCKTIKENVAIKQQLELMKMCGRVNNNPSLAYNENFRLLVSKCRGVTPTKDNTRPSDDKSLWDNMKDNYKKENPNVKIMGDKILLPPKNYKLPKPE